MINLSSKLPLLQHVGAMAAARAGHVVAGKNGGARPVEETGQAGGAGPVVLAPASTGAAVVAPKRSAYLGRIEDLGQEYLL
ncbi:hypothetical protein L1987_08216 [Smallanthus sonchifolius]|uniref:Uncharacterized protein n=1 Tax=Smallanthus sonchifolius TaxID=185202 RepID=A0ACB9JLW4_9ASTR|nr:hypothetical protein L1987_08216 [Smallanthus sonchifolius]